MPMYIVCALIYLAINLTLSSLSRTLEARTATVRE
jgi:ABC-type amino acid transport system permease subunit